MSRPLESTQPVGSGAVADTANVMVANATRRTAYGRSGRLTDVNHPCHRQESATQESPNGWAVPCIRPMLTPGMCDTLVRRYLLIGEGGS